jgi:Domain of unknown function (DUF4145)
MIFKIDTTNATASKESIIKLRCPSCRQRGTFDFVLSQDLAVITDNIQKTILGQRRCPDPNCHAHVFVAYNSLSKNVIVSYPSETIDFDSTDLPPSVIESFEEAIICHANQCYVASAIMVRKTLEELCKNRGATGNNLMKRLEDLRSKIVLPQELLDGLDDLRLLGNDAAHIELQEYDKVGQEEVSLAIEITKEVLKAVYQYSSLISKLQKFKKI